MSTATSQAPRTLTPEELAAVVRLFRETRGWSQEQLGEIARVAARTVQRVEDGQPSSLETRRALAGAFGFDDIDAFNKPYAIPTNEELAAAKERFEREHVTLKVAVVESGKQLAGLTEGCGASLFSEGVELSGEAEHLFASLSDYCREYGDCSELYSAVDKVAVYEELQNHVVALEAEGVCLVAATRRLVFKENEQDPGPGVRTDVLYVVAFPKGRAPEKIAVTRRVQFA
jgi:transcriptional regulator with XRE-family HTH domain